MRNGSDNEMDMKKDNPFIVFYGENRISPVHQNIKNINLHYLRREKLYRQLGIPAIIFNNRNILEVGPGGGYNSLAFFKWGARMDFVEPNPKAQEEIYKILEEHNIGKELWTLNKCKIEDFETERKYDVVIAEGFIPGIYNRAEVIDKLTKHVNPGGVIVVTCIDDISFFFEQIKRLIAWRLIKNIDDFNAKVRILTKAFSSHLAKLKGATRPVEDWVIDQFLNPALNAELFSIYDCINEFPPDFEYLGSSPSMFTDYSWYKDTGYDLKKSLLRQFRCKRHTLMMTEMEESMRSESENEELFKNINDVRILSKRYEIAFEKQCLVEIAELLRHIADVTKSIDIRIAEAINEAICLLNDDSLNEIKVACADKLACAFGKGQQYVSMVKRFTE